MLKRLERWSRWAIFVMLFLLPFAVYGVLNLPVGAAALHKWLPEGKPERQRYERFLEVFGNDHFLVISWDGCRVDDPRVDAFRERVLAEDNATAPHIESVLTTGDVVKILTSDPLNLSVGEAFARLKGFLVGPNGNSAVVVRFTEQGIANQKASIGLVFRAAEQVPNLGRKSLRMAGSIYETFAVDEASENSLKKLVLPSCLLGMLLSWACLRSVRAALAVLFIAGVGQLLAIAIVFYSGGYFSAVLIVLPTLVFMLTLSGAVHLMSYYGDVSRWHKNHLGARAMLLGFKPSLLASVTTSLGMAALATSQLAPVREFGLYSAVALSVATVFMLLGFPKVADWFCGGGKLQPADESIVDVVNTPEQSESGDAGAHPPQVSPRAQAYVRWLSKYANLVAGLGLVLMVVSFIGFLNLKSSTKFGDMFPQKSAVVRDMSWIEEHLGPIASVEVLLNFDSDCQLDLFERVTWVNRVAKQIRSSPDVGGVMSALTFLPPQPTSGSMRDVVKRSAMRKLLEKNLSALEENGWVGQSHDAQIWRITAKVSAIADENYGVLVDRIRNAVNKVAAADGESALPFTVEYTGLSPVMHETQLMLLRDLGASFSTAFLLITPVMMLIARGFWAGLLIMIPNVLPETLVFGMMAWMGFQLDVAGILTASVAMGIAVNDTLHFVNWYARRLSLGDDRAQAIADSLTSCARAMFHTMLISCCSMLPFLLAEFMPTRQFACLMIAMLSSALLGDLVLLPALLMSPLGRCLVPNRMQSVKSEDALG
ncbi:MAG: MMPL family transporter [Pirellulaceae bacterium]|nr:MMPL family transporter [Pirellulaceae bacterium]